MRCAERGPTPGRTRNASTSRSRPFEAGSESLATQNGSLNPAGRPRPAVMPLIFSAMVASTRCEASLNAAATRSSSISRSSPTSEGSMVTRFTSYLQVICTFTIPAPDWPPRACRLGAPRFALAVLDGGRAGARGLAYRDLHRDAAAEMLLESRLQLVLVVAIGQIGLLLRHCELEEAALAATQLGVAR